MKKIRIGVIGGGKISEVLHIPNIIFSEFAELVAIADPRKERLNFFKQKYGNIDIYLNYQDLLNDNSIEAVVVAVPNHLHAKISIDALNSGKSVLVEKPMATNSHDALKMIETAKKNNKVLMINQSQRFFPHHQKAKEIIRSGILGKIRLIKTMFSHSGPENWSENSSWFFKKEYAMFGALGDLGVHKIDLIRFLTGQEIVECFAYLGTLEKTGNVEDTASAILKLTNNIIATLDVNWITKGLEENYFVVYGEKGTMKIGQTNPNVIELYFTEPIKYTGKIELPPLFTNEDPYWKLPVIDHFAKVCKGIEKPIIAPEDGMISIKIIEKLFESFEKNGVVKIHE